MNSRWILYCRLAHLNLFILIALLLSTIRCTVEVDLYATGESIPVVYCLLNPSNDIQYVRIGRSFRAGGDAGIHPPAADSTVWNIPLQVYIEEYTGDIKSGTYHFEPDESIKKDSGFFSVENLQAYSSAFRAAPGKSYQLYVYFPDLKKMVSGRITVHGKPDIVDPLPLSIRKINFEPGQPYTIRWYPGMDAGVYELIFRVHYRDSSAFTNEFNSADYSSGGIFNQHYDQLQEYGMGGPAFLVAMAENVPVIPGMVRKVVSVEFIMIAGGTDLGFLYRSGTETGTNFTNLSLYSNLINGIGIFSSRSEFSVPNLALSEVTVDLLAHAEITRALGFKDSKGN